MNTREWQLSRIEAAEVKGVIRHEALKLGLEIVDKVRSKELKFEHEALADQEILISSEKYPEDPEEKARWNYGGLELSEGDEDRPYVLFAWGIKEDEPVDKVLNEAVDFASKLTGRDISADYF